MRIDQSFKYSGSRTNIQQSRHVNNMSSAGLQWLMELALELGWTKLHYIALNLNLKKKISPKL